MKRGDVVLVDFPFSTGGGSKAVPCPGGAIGSKQPAIAGYHRRHHHEQRVPVGLRADATLDRLVHPDWKASGLSLASAVKCEAIYTFNNRRILRRIGQLSPFTMQQVNDCLKTSLDIP